MLDVKIKDLGGIYKRFAPQLEKLGIVKVADFLLHAPNRFADFSQIKKIKDLEIDEIVTVIGKVKEIKNIQFKSFKKIQQAKIIDETGEIEAVWFNQPFLLQNIKVNSLISIAGRIEKNGLSFKITSPEYEIILNPEEKLIHTGCLTPIYPATKGISSKWLRKEIRKIITNNAKNIVEYIPYSIINKLDLMSLNETYEQFHFPKSLETFTRAKERLAFEEVFLLSLVSNLRKAKWEKNKTKIKINYDKFKNKIDQFIKSLPFKLTASQEKAIGEIFSDFKKEKPMNRLLLGDVGSGKTIVATIAMYLAFLNGYKSLIMVPTEILANQHFETISKILIKYGVKIKLIIGGQKKSMNLVSSTLESDIIIGTHALLEKNLDYKNLGLAIVDEQHRFGVEQRTILRNKGENLHFLTMSATPIPRTVVLTLYGDLDVSFLNEMPLGRQKVKTWFVPNIKKNNAYVWIEEKIKNNGQVFIICPFIEESENLTTVKAAKTEFENLKNIFKKSRLGLLHGQMKSGEKDKILNDFKAKKIDILIATPIVEVGIDIPNATVILIEDAERFGLAQLHQLRGRVGRGEKQSYCLLFSSSNNPKSITRLKQLEKINNGSELAELDLKLRGPGDVYGTLQSGEKILKIASFSDFDLISKAKNAANEIFPEIDKHPLLKNKLIQNLKEIMPD